MSSQRPIRERRWKYPARQVLSLGFGIVLLAGLVELLATRCGLPHVLAILAGLGKLWRNGSLQSDVQVSAARLLIGWAIGGSAGVMIGLTTGRVKLARVALEGFLILCRAIPFISLVPLAIRIFGLSETGKIFLVAWASAGVCWVVVHQASRELPPQLGWRAHSLGVSRRKWILRVLMPSCRVGIYTGLRTSLSLGLVVVAVAELSGVYERSSGRWWSEGLGYRLFRSLDEARDDLMLAGIFSFALLGIAVDQVFVGVWKLSAAVSSMWAHRGVRTQIAIARSAPPVGDFLSWKPGDLSIRDMCAGYGAHTILSGLSLDVPEGMTLAVVGPSGCGKSTLVRAIAHFTDSDFNVSGEVVAGGTVIKAPGPKIGVVLQDAPVFEHMTVWDNVMFGDSFCKEDRRRAARRVWELLSEFGLESLATQSGATLSGGQRQRVALACALANRPNVLVLDEPFGALDALTRRQLQRFYWEHIRGRVTAVFVTHDLEEALLIGDQVMVGVGVSSSTLQVDKEGLSPNQWELRDEFGVLRREIIVALEQVQIANTKS